MPLPVLGPLGGSNPVDEEIDGRSELELGELCRMGREIVMGPEMLRRMLDVADFGDGHTESYRNGALGWNVGVVGVHDPSCGDLYVVKGE